MELAQTIPGKAITISDVQLLIKDIANFVITISGVIVACFIVYAGIRMVISRGDEKQFGAAKKMLYNALIGAAVIFGVGVIINTIANFAQDPTSIY
jgi:prepilin signal peptidase PulO-like enzyme (type II secretory pathway)